MAARCIVYQIGLRGVRVQMYDDAAGAAVDGLPLDPGRPGSFRGDITWNELQQVKRDCGRGDVWAVEIYPPDQYVVDAANLRHLWLLPPSSTPWVGVSNTGAATRGVES